MYSFFRHPELATIFNKATLGRIGRSVKREINLMKFNVGNNLKGVKTLQELGKSLISSVIYE